MAVYYCAGRHRTDENDIPACDFKSVRPWRGRCPKCGGPYTCERIGSVASKGSKLTSAAGSQDPELEIKRTPTGIDGFDSLIKGGIAESQVILLAGQPGTRKTSLMLEVLESLSGHTTRPLLMASAEMNERDVLMFCQMLGVKSGTLKILGNVAHLEDVFNICDEIKPLILVLDSLQAVGRNSGVSEEEIANQLAKYCKRTNMVAVAINHMTKGLEIKGGTGPAHYVDTVMVFEPYIPEIDGDLVEVFGKPVVRELGLEPYTKHGMLDEKVPNLRVLTTVMKNRYGSIGEKSYFFTMPDGQMAQLKAKSKIEVVKG